MRNILALNWSPRQGQSRAASCFSDTEIDWARDAAQDDWSPSRGMGGLAKGLAVIRAFTREHAALSLSDIARSAGIPAATARRCLLTLEELGYVTRNGRDFLLRPKVLELGAAYLESMNIEHVTKTHLEELARNTGGLRGALRARRGRDRLRGASLGTHAAAARGARWQPVPGSRDIHRPRPARRRKRRTAAEVFRDRQTRGAHRRTRSPIRPDCGPSSRNAAATAIRWSRTNSPTE